MTSSTHLNINLSKCVKAFNSVKINNNNKKHSTLHNGYVSELDVLKNKITSERMVKSVYKWNPIDKGSKGRPKITFDNAVNYLIVNNWIECTPNRIILRKNFI